MSETRPAREIVLGQPADNAAAQIDSRSNLMSDYLSNFDRKTSTNNENTASKGAGAESSKPEGIGGKQGEQSQTKDSNGTKTESNVQRIENEKGSSHRSETNINLPGLTIEHSGSNGASGHSDGAPNHHPDFPNPNPIPNPEPGPRPEPLPRPEPIPGPSPRPEPLPRPEPTPSPAPRPEPIPTPGPQPRPEPIPMPIPHPRPEPGPMPEPQPRPLPLPHPVPRPPLEGESKEKQAPIIDWNNGWRK